MVPLGRWDVDQAIGGSPEERHARFGAWVDNAEAFDPAIYQLSKAEAVLMDPQQRMLMDVFYEAYSSDAARVRNSIIEYRIACQSLPF